MRIVSEFLLDQNSIDKDKNRIFISILKNSMESYDKSFYKVLFESGPKRKSYCFALYMKDAKFTRDEIIIPDKKIIFKLSTSSLEDSIHIYNALIRNVKKTYKVKGNVLYLNKIFIEKEKNIYDNLAVFETLSPIVARKHEGDNKKTWYYSLNDEEGRKLLLSNLKVQLIEEFGTERILDIEEVKIEVLSNKEVKVKNYSIVVLGNLCKLKIYAKPYILEYIYKSGIGGQRSSGFGMLDLVR